MKFIKETIVFRDWALGILYPSGNIEFLKICRTKPHLYMIPVNYFISKEDYKKHCRKATKEDFERINVSFHEDYLNFNIESNKEEFTTALYKGVS